MSSIPRVGIRLTREKYYTCRGSKPSPAEPSSSERATLNITAGRLAARLDNSETGLHVALVESPRGAGSLLYDMLFELIPQLP